MQLTNKKAVVTGANSGIGLQISKLFLEEGAQVVLSGRNKTALETETNKLGENAHPIVSDVTNLNQIENLFDETKNLLGSIDVLVANAGIATVKPFADTTEEDFDKQVDTNFKGAFFTIKQALPLMKEGGSIILISSIANTRGYEGMSVYGPTKSAVRGLTRTLARELSAKNIRVNCISPGPIDTPVFEKMGLPEEHVQRTKDAFASMVPLGRMGTVQEIAEGALFLASDKSSYITGIDLAIDGGTAQM